MSGDIDICWVGANRPSQVDRAEVMGQELGATGGSRSWKVAGLFVDLLGELESHGKQYLTELQTPTGRIILPLRWRSCWVFSARAWAGKNPADENCARILLSAALDGGLKITGKKLSRLPAFQTTIALPI